ncbi:MAG: hypothetical protein AAB912_03350 [Patescibacteria group bacterium]
MVQERSVSDKRDKTSPRRIFLRGGLFFVALVVMYFAVGFHLEYGSALTRTQGSGTQGRIAKWVPTPPPVIDSCAPSFTEVRAGQSVVWSAQVSGGNGEYAFLWSGDAPLGGSSSNPAYAVYQATGIKSGSLTVTSDGLIVSRDCGTVEVLPGILSFEAVPARINPSEESTLSWSTSGFDSCTITADRQSESIGPVAGSGSQRVSPTERTVYTLTCQPGPQSQSVSVQVTGLPAVREIAPE